MLGWEYPYQQREVNDCCGIIRRFSEVAGVITNDYTHKYAGSHDIGRKAFINRLRKDRRISVFELRKLVRHASIETTAKHYIHDQADELGSRYLGWNDTQ